MEENIFSHGILDFRPADRIENLHDVVDTV